MITRLEDARKLFAVLSRQSHISPILTDLFRIKRKTHGDRRHLDETIAWLCRAQDVSGVGGVSGGYYSAQGGWLPPYPETTGYIIPTFLAYAGLTGVEEYRERAVRMGDWEIAIQLELGAVRGGVGNNTYPIVFNTGQVILGWNALYRETGEARFLESAVRAGKWLVSVQDGDGKWTKCTINDMPHAYHTRVAWPLLELCELSGDVSFGGAGTKNIEWILSQANERGWFGYMGFALDAVPLTHTIAYTLRGLIESSRYLASDLRNEALRLVIIAAESVIKQYESGSRNTRADQLSAELDEMWRPRASYSCVTGNAQMAIVWLHLRRMANDARFSRAARSILDQVKATQSLSSSNKGIRGALPGSVPFWGSYNPFSYPNWAAKFFADALLLLEADVVR